MFRTIGIVLATSLLGGGVPAEQAFKEWAEHAVGGVWTSTSAKGNKEEFRCEWILSKSFVQMTGKHDLGSFQAIFGIDPATGKWTSWGFDSEGRVSKGINEGEKAGEWTFRESGNGK